MSKVLKKQIGGQHYNKLGCQPWEIIDSHGLNFYEGNVLKYLIRRKDPKKRVEDLKKAKHYIEKMISDEKKRKVKNDSTRKR